MHLTVAEEAFKLKDAFPDITMFLAKLLNVVGRLEMPVHPHRAKIESSSGAVLPAAASSSFKSIAPKLLR